MAILETLILIISTTFSTTKANDDNICPTSNCGTLSISYPFKLHDPQTQANCSYIDLKCNETTGTTTTTIRHVGDFYVSSIYYDEYDPSIILHETRDCLMMKSLARNNFTLSLSPFDSQVYFNYTFYLCSSYPNTTERYYKIDCLSSPGNVTLAVDSFLSLNVTNACREIGSRVLPISITEVGRDIFLTWKSIICPACEKSSPLPGDTDNQDLDPWQPPSIKDNSMQQTYLSQTFVVIAVTITVCSMLIARIMIKKDGGNAGDGLPESAAATAAAAAGGLDEARMNCCTELLVVSESFISDSRACPICLESFKPRELSRSIPKCGHCFHDECVVPWLIVSGTCPVCRIIISV